MTNIQHPDRLVIELREQLRTIAKAKHLNFSSEIYFAKVRKNDPDPFWLIVEQRESLHCLVYYYGEWLDGRQEVGTEMELQVDTGDRKAGFRLDEEDILTPEQAAKTLLAPLLRS